MLGMFPSISCFWSGTALSSSPFLFPEAWRSSSHVRECAATHKWEGNHWVQDCWESRIVSLRVTQDPAVAVMTCPTLREVTWDRRAVTKQSVAVPALCPLHMGGEV